MIIKNIRTKQITTKFGEKNMVLFTGTDGQEYSSFDEWLADVGEGTDVAGTVSTKETADGKVFRNFKADKKSDANYQLASATAPSAAPAPVATKAAANHVPAEVWERKDRQMARMSAAKAAATVYDGSTDREGFKALANEVFAWITELPAQPVGEENQPPVPPIDLDEIPF